MTGRDLELLARCRLGARLTPDDLPDAKRLGRFGLLRLSPEIGKDAYVFAQITGRGAWMISTPREETRAAG